MKHIETIEITNFKSIRHQKLEGCRRVNIFVGYPNVGKSNLLEALSLLSVMELKSEHFSFNQICRTKHFSELFFDNDTRKKNSVVINDKISVDLDIGSNSQIEIIINSLLDHQNLPGVTRIAACKIKDSNFSIELSGGWSYSDYSKIIGPVKKYEFVNDVSLTETLSQVLATPYGNNLFNVLRGNAEVRRDVVELLKVYGLKLVLDGTDNSIKLQKELADETVISTPYHQVADTLRRLIFYKAAIKSNTGSVLLLEEPEAHMFPPYISKFTSDVVYDERDNQYFISTHSPVVISDFLENLPGEDFAVFTVGYLKETGETVTRKLSDDELGEVYQYGVDLLLNLENFLPNVQGQQQ